MKKRRISKKDLVNANVRIFVDGKLISVMCDDFESLSDIVWLFNYRTHARYNRCTLRVVLTNYDTFISKEYNVRGNRIILVG